jgi:tetratricopeptide (TPR) repeat protein
LERNLKIKLKHLRLLRNVVGYLFLINLLCYCPASATTVDDYMNTGIDRYDQGEFEQSIPYFDKVIELQPDNWTALQYEAYAYSKLKDFKSSADAAHKSLLINQDNPSLQAFYDVLKTEVMAGKQNNKKIRTVPDSDVDAADSGSADLSSLKKTTKEKKTGKIIIQIQGGLDLPLNTNFAQNYNAGFGGEAMIGYAFDENLTLGLLSGFHNYNSKYNNLTYNGWFSVVPVEVVAQYNIGKNKFKPYFILGAGACFDIDAFSLPSSSSSASTYGTTSADFLLEPGLGFSYEVSDNFNLFIQTKVTIDFRNSYGISDPVYLPIQVGGNFSL